MTSTADRTISALRTGHDDLVAVLGRLRPDDLTRTSGASEWTVAQVYSHLGSGAEINLAALEASLDGAAKAGPDFNKTVWARWDGMSPAEQAENYPSADERLVARYEALDERDREERRIDLGFLPEPVDVAMAGQTRLTEVALHSWDIRVTFDSAATVAPEALALLLDNIGGLVAFGGKADRFDGTARIAVHMTDPDRSFGLTIADGVSMTEVPQDPDAELTAGAEYILRLVTGRHAPEHTPASVSLTGAVTLDELRNVFPGY